MHAAAQHDQPARSYDDGHGNWDASRDHGAHQHRSRADQHRSSADQHGCRSNKHDRADRNAKSAADKHAAPDAHPAPNGHAGADENPAPNRVPGAEPALLTTICPPCSRLPVAKRVTTRT